jgi:hypothetical protein
MGDLLKQAEAEFDLLITGYRNLPTLQPGDVIDVYP